MKKPQYYRKIRMKKAKRSLSILSPGKWTMIFYQNRANIDRIQVLYGLYDYYTRIFS